MAGPLDGRTVALAEGRQLEELAQLLEAEGASVRRYPLLSILDAPDAASVHAWIDELINGRFALVVLMTGEAVRRLVGFAERQGKKEAFLQALATTRTISRGPKPVAALRELGLKPSQIAPAPTTEGVLTCLQEEPLAGLVVGFTLYGSDNPRLSKFLVSRGATPRPVLSYIFAPASDDVRVAELITLLAKGAIDIVVFTSSPQVERLLEVATKSDRIEELLRGLQLARVAAVGPLVAEALRQRGVTVSICPEQGWVMKNLVRQMARQ